MKSVIFVTFGCLMFISACVGSPVHRTITYNHVQETITKNNHDLLSLKIGMKQQDVDQLLGDPERSEGYKWGTVWMYRTAMTSGIYGTADADFTPVVFDNEGILKGWGRNFFQEKVHRYEIKKDVTIKKEPS